MRVHFDVDKLKKLMTDFNTCTNITITLFDRNMNCITDVGTWQPYCLAIGDDPKLLTQCSCCNRDNSQKSLNQRSTLMYTCHAGIAEVVTPIFQDNTFIAYLMLGKFRDAEGKYSTAQMVVQAAEKYGLDKDRMLEAYYKLPVLDSKCINSAISLLEMLIYYITSENLFHYDHSVRFDAIDKYIEENIGGKITIEDICNHFNIPRHLLYVTFENECGDSIQEYIIKKRIRKAQNLLSSTDLSISEISTQVGYPDYSYFFRIFKKFVGDTPLQYRKKQNSTYN